MAGDVDQPVILGGFPVSGLNKYVGQLVRQGHSVAIAMQDESKEWDNNGLEYVSERLLLACCNDSGIQALSNKIKKRTRYMSNKAPSLSELE